MRDDCFMQTADSLSNDQLARLAVEIFTDFLAIGSPNEVRTLAFARVPTLFFVPAFRTSITPCFPSFNLERVLPSPPELVRSGRYTDCLGSAFQRTSGAVHEFCHA